MYTIHIPSSFAANSAAGLLHCSQSEINNSRRNIINLAQIEFYRFMYAADRGRSDEIRGGEWLEKFRAG